MGEIRDALEEILDRIEDMDPEDSALLDVQEYIQDAIDALGVVLL